VARDAIARLYDVEKNRVALEIDKGTITFSAKRGNSIELNKIHESIKATRLSGNTGMRVNALEITAVGKVVVVEAQGEKPPTLRLKVNGTLQEFVLGEGANNKLLQQLREAVGASDFTVTGRVDGWNSHFPPFLNSPPPPGNGDPPLLIVTEFKKGK